MERELYMVEGNGETSYAKNSRLQANAMLKVKPLLEEVIIKLSMTLAPVRTMVIADLGCSSGPNTLLFVSTVVGVIQDLYCKSLGGHSSLPAELHFFLNDLPKNDFNNLFRSLNNIKKMLADRCPCTHGGEMVVAPPYYVVGCRVPSTQGFFLIVASTSSIPPTASCGALRCDKLRSEEFAPGGQMLLTLLGRKNIDAFKGDLNHLHGLLGQTIQSLVAEGKVEKEKLDTFNLPIYGPSIGEVTSVVWESGLFNIDHIKLFESNWDPYDDIVGDFVHDSIQSGLNVARCIRAVMEPLFASHFGEHLLDELFKRYAVNVAEHLKKEKTKYSIIVMLLNSKG